MASFLEMRKITKSFSGNVVLNNVDFCVDKGQVHALVGENGAGKSTLMKILSGLYPPDSGEIFIDGKKVSIAGPKQAQELGIAMIYQDICLFPDLNIGENIFIRREPIQKTAGINHIDWDKVYSQTKEYLDYFSLKITPHTQVNTLSIAQQKFVEIIKALSQKAGILIMDEPTAALTEFEVELLFNVIKDTKKLGVAIIYISHRLDEIKRIADTVTIIRDGEVIDSYDARGVSINTILKAMVGKEIEDRYPKLKIKMGKEILRVQSIGYSGFLKDINFSVRKGEILGITGLSGSGRTMLAKVLFGIEGPYDGQIYLNGKIYKQMTPYISKYSGLCYVPGIGNDEGIISNATVEENITLANLKRISRLGFINRKLEAEEAQDLINRLEINEDRKEMAGNLSGGRQKKVIFGKWLFTNAKVIIIDEPTAGIDIGSKVDIYNIINELALSGVAVIINSSDFSEVMGMCDRIAVMFNGEIRKIFNQQEASQAKILFYASGGEDKEADE